MAPLLFEFKSAETVRFWPNPSEEAVRVTDESRNGIYTVSSIGNSQKQVFQYDDALVDWFYDIYDSVLSDSSSQLSFFITYSFF